MFADGFEGGGVVGGMIERGGSRYEMIRELTRRTDGDGRGGGGGGGGGGGDRGRGRQQGVAVLGTGVLSEAGETSGSRGIVRSLSVV